MANTQANGITIEYDTFGDVNARPLLMIMGYGAQMIGWDEDFCELLANKGHYVIRFDNRDVGLSSSLDHLGAPDVAQLTADALAGKALNAPYGLSDMANDAAALLDTLEIPAAHICGASMGGMIAQKMAILHPAKVKSMTSIMSTTGNQNLPQATEDAMAALMSPREDNRDAAGDRAVRVSKVVGSPGFPFDEARVRNKGLRAFDRGYNPDGVTRQMIAIMSDGDRRADLNNLDIPALIIHGKADPLVPLEGGLDTHANIKNAELLLIDGMGHDLPEGAWSEMAAAITDLTIRSH